MPQNEVRVGTSLHWMCDKARNLNPIVEEGVHPEETKLILAASMR